MLELGLLYLIVNVVAVDYSFSLTEKEIYKLIIEIGDKGYKINSEKIYRLKEDIIQEKTNIISQLAILIPGLNIMKTKNDIAKLKQNVKETIENYDILTKMTDDEKELYSIIDTDEVKLLYLSSLSQNNEFQLQSNNKKLIKLQDRN